MRMQRAPAILLAAIILAVAGWSSYWFIGARTVSATAAQWFEDLNGGAMTASHQGLSVLGFPNRFDLTVTQPQVFSEWDQIGWNAPFLQFFALSYQPRSIIAVWPNDQSLQLRGERLDVRSEDLRASIMLGGGSVFGLDRITLVGEQLHLTSDRGWQAGLDNLRFATRRAETEHESHDVALAVFELTPDRDWRIRMGAVEDSAEVIQLLYLDTNIELETVPGAEPESAATTRLSTINLKQARMVWDDMELIIEGALDVDEFGILDGQLTVRAQNWARLVDIAAQAGIFNPERAPLIIIALNQLANNNPREDGMVEAPLRVRQGQISLGPIPLGRAPRLAGL